MAEESPSGGRSRIYKRGDDRRADAGTATWALAALRAVFRRAVVVRVVLGRPDGRCLGMAALSILSTRLVLS